MIHMRMETTKETMEKLERWKGEKKKGRKEERKEGEIMTLSINNQFFTLAGAEQVYTIFYSSFSSYGALLRMKENQWDLETKTRLLHQVCALLLKSWPAPQCF